jgi:hypothetical protein
MKIFDVIAIKPERAGEQNLLWVVIAFIRQKIRTSDIPCKMLDPPNKFLSDKHSSLFVWNISGEKRFLTSKPRALFTTVYITLYFTNEPNKLVFVLGRIFKSEMFIARKASGLYYKSFMIVIYDCKLYFSLEHNLLSLFTILDMARISYYHKLQY